MSTLAKFMSDLDALYQTPSNRAVRIADDIMTQHVLTIRGLNITATRYMPTDGLFPRETYVLNIAKNLILRTMPVHFYDVGQIAQAVFNCMEKASVAMNLTQPLSQKKQDLVINAIDKMRAGAKFSRETNGPNFINTYRLITRPIQIVATEEYNAQIDDLYCRASIKNKLGISPFPKYYDTINSDDNAFAQRIIAALSTRVH